MYIYIIGASPFNVAILSVCMYVAFGIHDELLRMGNSYATLTVQSSLRSHSYSHSYSSLVFHQGGMGSHA